jgi:hypothetical protein
VPFPAELKLQQAWMDCMAKSRAVITRARLGRAGRHAFTGLSDGRLTPKTAFEDSKLELNHSYLDEPEVVIIQRMDQPGFDRILVTC